MVPASGIWPSHPWVGHTDPGLRLLAEFDGLLLGYYGDGMHRFIDRSHLHEVWARVNGPFSLVVLKVGDSWPAGRRSPAYGCRPGEDDV